MDPVKIGYFIRNCRKEKGFTQEELANKIFVSPKQSQNGNVAMELLMSQSWPACVRN